MPPATGASKAGYYTQRISEYAVEYPNKPVSPCLETPTKDDLEPQIDLSKVDALLETWSYSAGELSALLDAVMDLYGYLPLRQPNALSRCAALICSDIFGIATMSPKFKPAPAPSGKGVTISPYAAWRQPSGACGEILIMRGSPMPDFELLIVYCQRVAALTSCATAYRGAGGYRALEKAIRERRRKRCEQVLDAQLRGRGGAGRLTGEKWRLVRNAVDDQQYVICNAYDADPRSLMARSLMERNPHEVIEGILLAAYAVGASEAYIFTHTPL